MITSPRFADSVRKTSNDPRAIVRMTAVMVSAIPTRLTVERRSRSIAEAARATTPGAAAPRIPALAGVVNIMPVYQSTELPKKPLTPSTITAVRSRRARRGSGPSSTRVVSTSRGAAISARSAASVIGPSSERPSLARGKLPAQMRATTNRRR